MLDPICCKPSLSEEALEKKRIASSERFHPPTRGRRGLGPRRGAVALVMSPLAAAHQFI